MEYTTTVSYVAMEQLHQKMYNTDSMESFNFVRKIFDIFYRIVNNFKTSIIHIKKDFKRSELQAYHDSHHFVINKLLKSPYFDPTISVPIPSGMKVTYLKAIVTIEDLYKTLNITTTLNILQDYFSEYAKTGILKNSDSITKLILNLNKDTTQSTLQTLFTTDKTLEVPLGQVISSSDELFIVDKHILIFNEIFQQTPMICKQLEDLEKQVDNLVTLLESDPTRTDKILIESLYNLIMAASVQFDMLGVILDLLQRVEHNFTILFRRVVQNTTT